MNVANGGDREWLRLWVVSPKDDGGPFNSIKSLKEFKVNKTRQR